MNRFFGEVGFAQTVETEPGIWEEQATSRNYYGNIVKDNRRLQSSEHLNDNITISTSISIVADQFATENFMDMRYVVYKNRKWKVSNVEPDGHRLILTLGGVYNGK